MIVTEGKINSASLLPIQITSRRRGAQIILAIFSMLFLLGTGAAQRASAQTTTLTFDDVTNGTALTTQYQSLGVTISGAVIYASCTTCYFPSVTGSNVAYSPNGSMTFTFDSTVVGGSA
jgi:hypothetical protein